MGVGARSVDKSELSPMSTGLSSSSILPTLPSSLVSLNRRLELGAYELLLNGLTVEIHAQTAIQFFCYV